RVKMSQDDVSQALDMTRPAYKQLETNERTPTNAELIAISELFGVRVEALISPDPLENPSPEDKDAADIDKVKYKNLVLYLAQRVGARPNVGETVFYKLIYFIETLARSTMSTGITNERFYKMQYGPVPASFHAVTNEMIEANELDRVKGRYFTFMQTKYLPRVEATGLTNEEIGIVEKIITALGRKSATELSDLSHQDEPWKQAADGAFVDLNLIQQTDAAQATKMGRI
ncbi:MAG: type II toxin-antitoxin system antitoxin SocA domain-containing protein, partial [Patescibacteria group bacterium]